MEGLVGIQRIVVHEPKISANRIRTAFAIIRRGCKTETVTYDIRYQEDVFALDSEVDSALARMVALQPLVNLGLFAGRLETEFPLDPLDVVFLNGVFSPNFGTASRMALRSSAVQSLTMSHAASSELWS